jgi:acyl carrier protein
MDTPINERLKQMIVERLFLSITPAEIPDDANLMKTLGVDSVQIFELVVGCEETFAITFEEGDFDITAFQTVNAIAEVVRRKLQPGGTS